MSARSIITSRFLRHAGLVVAGFTLLFTWLCATPIVVGTLLAESDMYEQFLPRFLAPITFWSSYEFGGWPAFADFQDTVFYPPRSCSGVSWDRGRP